MKRVFYILLCLPILLGVQVTKFMQINGAGTLEGETITVNAAIGDAVSGDLESESYTASTGLLVLSSPEEGIEEFENLMPSALHIAGINPNPFNSRTEIAFNVPEDGEVKIRIYSAQGRRLINSDMNLKKGMNAIIWEADEVPSGIYVLSIFSGDEKASAKLVLVK